VHVRISKRADGASVIRCTRPDGSVVWQKIPKHGGHFALHDLTHFAVESALGIRRGFFGLLAEGWDFDDVTGKGARGALPPEAAEAEKIVGLFDMERATGGLWTLAEFNAFAPREMREEEILKVRSLRGELFRRWADVPTGQELELEFSR
jgi:hypothetical protein